MAALDKLLLTYLMTFSIYPSPSGCLWGPKVSQLDRKSGLFANDTLHLVPNLQTNTKNWPKRMQWIFQMMFNPFSNQTLTLKWGLRGPKESQCDRKSWFLVNVSHCLVPNPQINTKIDLNSWNEHSVRCLTSYKIRCLLYGESVGSRRNGMEMG